MTVHQLATDRLACGVENMLVPGSTIITTGGLKKLPEIPNLLNDLYRFAGNGVRQHDDYGMTQILSGFTKCEAGRHHIYTWLLAFLLNPKTGEALPRDDVQRGRFTAFNTCVSTSLELCGLG